MKLSIVTPVYQAEMILEELVDRIKKSAPKDFQELEIILVDDGSKDNSWRKIEELVERHREVLGIKLSRNFGQHYAITAGLDHVIGDWIVVMDCDLQDQPEEIKKLFEKSKEGYDIVLARRNQRKDGLFKLLFSKLFYRTLAYLSGSEQDETIANFGIYNKKVVTQVQQLRESIRYFPTMIKWVGFRSAKVNVEHAGRAKGKSNYNVHKMLNLALDIMLAFSDKPLRLTVKFGIIVALISFAFAIYTLLLWLAGNITVLGYASLITSIWFLTGCILITLGIVGLYVGKTFEGVKNRPIYIIDKISANKKA